MSSVPRIDLPSEEFAVWWCSQTRYQPEGYEATERLVREAFEAGQAASVSVRAAAERMVQTYRDWMAGCENETRWKEVEAAHINLRDALRHKSNC